jgi:hypothetical protein
MGCPLGQPPYMGGPSGQPRYMGGPSGQPKYMGGQPQYMGGPSDFSIPSQPIYGPTSVHILHGYYQYP